MAYIALLQSLDSLSSTIYLYLTLWCVYLHISAHTIQLVHRQSRGKYLGRAARLPIDQPGRTPYQNPTHCLPAPSVPANMSPCRRWHTQAAHTQTKPIARPSHALGVEIHRNISHVDSALELFTPTHAQVS